MYLALKFAKLVAVALLLGAAVGALVVDGLEQRRKLVYRIAGPALAATWSAGFGLAWVTQVSIASWWVLAAMVLSLLAVQALLYVAGRDGRRNVWSALLVVAPLVGCIAIMVYRQR